MYQYQTHATVRNTPLSPADWVSAGETMRVDLLWEPDYDPWILRVNLYQGDELVRWTLSVERFLAAMHQVPCDPEYTKYAAAVIVEGNSSIPPMLVLHSGDRRYSAFVSWETDQMVWFEQLASTITQHWPTDAELDAALDDALTRLLSREA